MVRGPSAGKPCLLNEIATAPVMVVRYASERLRPLFLPTMSILGAGHRAKIMAGSLQVSQKQMWEIEITLDILLSNFKRTRKIETFINRLFLIAEPATL